MKASRSKTTDASAWENYKRALRAFNAADVGKLYSQRSSWAIVGDAGVGKSSFLLWSLDRAFGQAERDSQYSDQRGLTVSDIDGFNAKEYHPNKPWFKKVVFLSPKRYELWTEALAESDYDPNTTLIAVDAPFRLEDNDEIKRLKAEKLNEIRGGIEEDKAPFEIVVTVRREEYVQLAKTLGSSLQQHEVRWTEWDLWTILTGHLSARGVRNEVTNPSPQNIALLMQRSEGLPIYCEGLAALLQSLGQTFSTETLQVLPPGIANLVFDVVEKSCSRESARQIILSLIALLAETGEGFSPIVFDRIIAGEILEGEQDRGLLRRAWSLLETFYLENVPAQSPLPASLRLSPQWSRAVRGLTAGNIAADPRYFDSCKALGLRWQELPAFKDRIMRSLLPAKLSHEGDFVLLAEIPKVSDQATDAALLLWNTSGGAVRLHASLREPLTKLFYEAVVSRGFKAAAEGPTQLDRVTKYFDAAGRIRSDVKDLMAYIGYLRRYGLGQASTEVEFEHWKSKIEGVFDALVKLNENDKLTLNFRGSFWAQVREFDKAERDFQKAESIQSGDAIRDLTTLLAFAGFLAGRGRSLRNERPEDAEQNLSRAEEYYQKGLDKLQAPTLDDELKGTKLAFLGGFARALIDRLEFSNSDLPRRREMAEKAIRNLREALQIDPADSRAATLLGGALIKYGRLFHQHDRYRTLADARGVMETALGAATGVRRPLALHLLGRFLYRSLPPAMVDFEKAAKYLEGSAEEGDALQKSAAYRELGKLYFAWARSQKPASLEAAPRLALAEGYLTKSIQVHPETPNLSYRVLAYTSLVRVALRQQETTKAQGYLSELRTIAKAQKSSQFIGKAISQTFIEAGNEFLSEGDPQSAAVCFEHAMEADDRSWWAATQLGNCYADMEKPSDCLACYRVASQRATDSGAFGSIRNGVNEAKQHLYRILTRDQLAEFQEAMLDNSSKAYDLSPTNWKNSQDLSEDFLATKHFTEAICHASETSSLVARFLRTGRVLDKVGTRKWARAHVRSIRSRQKWVLAKANVALHNRERAKKLLWTAASLDDQGRARSWFEAVTLADEGIKDPHFVIRAYRQYLARVGELSKAARKPLLFNQLPKLMRRARNNFESIRDYQEQALTSKYFEVLCLLDKNFTRYALVRRNWWSAKRLIEIGEYPWAFELLLNYLRLGLKPAYVTKGLSELEKTAERLGHIALAQGIGQERRQREVVKFRVSREAARISSPSTKSSRAGFERAIISELTGNADKAFEFYRDCLARPELDVAAIGAFSPAQALRIMADGFILRAELPRAAECCERLASLVMPPEGIYVECLQWHIAEPRAISEIGHPVR